MKIAVLFGSSSNEHEVSIASASHIIYNLDKKKYNIVPIYLDKENNFYVWKEDLSKIKPLKIGIKPINIEPIKNAFEYLKEFNLIFNVVHGKNGEDGILNSIFDFLNIKYIGNKPNASLITMDKIITKDILELNNIKTSKYIYFTKYNDEYVFKDNTLTYNELISKIENLIKYPLFIKPANSGSSIGITKAKNQDALKKGIEEALKIDNRILIEEEVIGREVECGILEKDGTIITSCIGEIISNQDFYSYDAKYINDTSLTLIPASIDEFTTKKIQEIAKKAFKVLNCHIYSRIDFFITNESHIILNEINTIPGFTNISMYPKLFEASNIEYKKLLDILINEAIKKA